MRLFTSNQVNHVYVAKAVKSNLAGLTTDGDILVKEVEPEKDGFYIQHKGPGGVTRSDLIKKCNILWTSYKEGSDDVYTLNKYTVTLDNRALDNGTVIGGQDFILRVTFYGYVGVSPEDSQYWKYGMVHSYTGMTTSEFYKKLAVSLAQNMRRESVQFLKVFVGNTEVTPTMTEADITGTATSVIIKETEPDWILGLKQQKFLHLEVVPGTVETEDGEFTWGSVVAASDSTIPNGKKIADLEYFSHGERGDQYRMVGWPDYIPTKYLVDETLSYDIINIHYSYIGSNESVQKSEKDLTIVCPASSASAVLAAINAKLPKEYQLGGDGSTSVGDDTPDSETTQP